MKDVIKMAISNPFGTAIAVGTICSGIAEIIRAVSGIKEVPGINVNISKQE